MSRPQRCTGCALSAPSARTSWRWRTSDSARYWPASRRNAGSFAFEPRITVLVDRIAVIFRTLELEQLPLARALVGECMHPGLLQRDRILDGHLLDQGVRIALG